MKHIEGVITIKLAYSCGTAALAAAHSSTYAADRLVPEDTRDYEAEGRKITRFDHPCLKVWGYGPENRNYFYVVHPKVTQALAPLLVILHSAGGDAEAELPAYLKKPWFQELTAFYAVALNSGVKSVSDPDHWYGRDLIRNDQQTYAAQLTPVENRLLATIYWVVRHYPIDPERVYLYGASMGGSGGLGPAMPHGDLFAAAYLEIPAGYEHFYQRMRLAKPLASGGSPASETQNKRCRPPDPPLLVFFASQMDSWAEHTGDFLHTLREERYAMVFAWGPWGHVANWWSFPGANPAVFEFSWQAIRKNESYPVFTSATTDDHWPGFKSVGADQQGQINAYFRWTNVIDTSRRYAMEFRLIQDCELTHKVSTPAESTVDVSIRRLQKLDVRKLTTYHWTLEREGKFVSSGQLHSDGSGLLRIPRLTFTPEPSRLTIGRTD
jgi:hypothetical protein